MLHQALFDMKGSKQTVVAIYTSVRTADKLFIYDIVLNVRYLSRAQHLVEQLSL